jgi:hypothetical protein
MQMQAPSVVKVTFDEASIAWLGELSDRLSAFEKPVDLPVEIRQLIRDLPRGAAGLDFEPVATRTSERRIVLKPSERWIHLMAALRTFDGRSHAVG